MENSASMTLGDWLQDIFPDRDLDRTLAWIKGAAESLAKALTQAALWFAEFAAQLEKTPAVPGYERLLIDRGQHPLVARFMSQLLVQSVLRDVEDSKAERHAAAAIRFLAKPKASQTAMNRRAALLLEASSGLHRLDAFDKVGMSAFNFEEALKRLRRAEFDSADHVRGMAQLLAPHLRVRRGPKVKPASLAHEMVLRVWSPLLGRCGYTWNDEIEDFTDPITKATREAFADETLNPQPARRRQRRLARRS